MPDADDRVRALPLLRPTVRLEVACSSPGGTCGRSSGSRRCVFFSLAMPIIMLTLFSQVFKSDRPVPGLPRRGLVHRLPAPRVLCTTLAQSATTSSTAIATDLETGWSTGSAPCRSTRGPCCSPATSATSPAGTQSLIMLVLGLAVFGFRFHGTLLEAVATVLVALPLSFAMNWLFIWIGVLVKKPETTQIAGMLVTFPLMFASSAYVPIASLPGWLQAVAKVNPLSYTVDAAGVRARPPRAERSEVVLIAAVLACVSIVGATTAYRRIDR